MDWETEQSSQELVHLIKEQIRLKPSFNGFSESEVLETLIIQTCKRYILAIDREGVERMARLAVRLRKEGVVDMIDVGKQLGISLTELVKTYPDKSSLVFTWVKGVFP